MDTISDIIDRTHWPPGEWDNEPDRGTWVHEETGARCTIRRGPMGHWCGYVGLNPNHPSAGNDYNNIVSIETQELTFADYCHPIAEDEWIRHRLRREKWLTESLIFPEGDAAKYLREDRKGDTSTMAGYLKWVARHVLCHDDCPHGLWWVGFDCAHAFDIAPALLRYQQEIRNVQYPSEGRFAQTYKNMDYVIKATDELAAELFTERVLNQGDKK